MRTTRLSPCSLPLFALAALASIAAIASCSAPRAATAPQTARAHEAFIVVDITPDHIVQSFIPRDALGAGIDRMPTDATDKMYAPESLKQVLSSGWGAVSYRLNTELHVEAWHWNPQGTYSDPRGKGYFTGSTELGEPIRHSFGYPLPRRGFTRNEGTENHGFSRLMDGDLHSFWKSNPYLSHAFTGDDDAAYPQWIVIDVGSAQPMDALRIAWGAPYARAYRIQYWTGSDAIKLPARGDWHDFDGGVITNGTGGTTTHKLGGAGKGVRFLRISMTQSSETCDRALASDKRNCVGFAINELYVGTFVAGEFRDIAHHSPDQSQSATFCSSVDPWHEPSNIDERGDQSGLDLFYTAWATRGLPAMVPVAVLYDTPENAAAEIAYLEKRKYPISYIELGEEADGQYMTPEHYAQLYLQWATALHKVDPKLLLGGPAFTGVNEEIRAWPDAHGNTSWLARFLRVLEAHDRLSDFAFMSFEHYPYEPCQYGWKDLYDEPRLISHIMDVWRDDGLPPDIPMFVTEVNIAWRSNGPFVDLFGGLWLADYVGAFFAAGGTASYYFHYLPYPISQDCDATAGAFTMFTADANFQIKQPTSQYFAAKLITQEWTREADRPHHVFRASSDSRDVTAYALKLPNGQWSLMLVNKDRDAAHPIRIMFRDDTAKREFAFGGTVRMSTFGAEQYTWHMPPDAGNDAYADPDGPAVTREIHADSTDKDAVYTLPRASVTVLRGDILAKSAAPI